MGRFFRLIVSRRVAVALMLAMALVLALSSLVPEPDLTDPARLAELERSRPVALFVVQRLRPERIARSPAFLVLPALVFFSTAHSIVTRVRAEVVRRRRGPVPPLRFRFARTAEVGAGAPVALASARRLVRQAGFGLHAEEKGDGGAITLVATRGSLGFAGSIVFHVGILVVLAGVVVSSMGRCGGEVMLAEGFPVTLGPETIFRAQNRQALARLEGVTVGVRDFAAEFDKGFNPVDYAAVFEVSRANAAPSAQVVRVNEPVWVDDFQFTMFRYGFAPTVAVLRGGEVLADGTAILKLVPPGTEDGLALSGGTELRLALYPDHARQRGVSVSRTLSPINPVLEVRVLENGAEVARGAVARGQEIALGPLRIAFPALAYWADFLVTRDPGLLWITIGSGLIALGLAVRFWLHPEVVRITIAGRGEGAQVHVALEAQYFPALAEERADGLAAALVASEAPDRARANAGAA